MLFTNMQLTYAEIIHAILLLGILLALWGIYREVRKLGAKPTAAKE
jgi:hypothetical protein